MIDNPLILKVWLCKYQQFSLQAEKKTAHIQQR